MKLSADLLEDLSEDYTYLWEVWAKVRGASEARLDECISHFLQRLNDGSMKLWRLETPLGTFSEVSTEEARLLLGNPTNWEYRDPGPGLALLANR